MIDGETPRLPPRASSRDPLVTVVMPTYRRSNQIGEGVRSLLRGTWRDFELLVRDDGDGCDRTAQAVRAASEGDSRVRYHRNERRLGMPGNLNAGILESRGSLIAVCHDHDVYKSSFLEEMVGSISRHPGALFVHCGIDVVRQDGTFLRTHLGDWPELSPGHAWLKFMLSSLYCPVCALSLVRREAHEQYGLYDASYGYVADVEMWMRLAMHGDVAYVRQAAIQVREPEENHWALANGVVPARIVARIHRRYIPCAYDPWQRPFRRLLLEARLAHQVARDWAAWIVHRMPGWMTG